MKRRQFLAAASAAAAPLFIPRRAFGANDRVVTAHIGVGNQGTGNLMRFADNAAIICDVDQTMLDKAATKFEKDKGRKLELETDFRRILDRKDIDAVVITTPDHWHAIPTILACSAGKDVYCEKPLSLTIEEGKAMVQAAREHQRVVQTGSQQRSSPEFLLACRLVRSGRIGRVTEVHVGIPASNHPYRDRAPIADSQPPSSLDYDFWLGPAPIRPYNVDRVHYNFRFFWDYSGGQMTNFGAHQIDIAHWGLGMDDSGPLTVEGTARFHPQGRIDVPLECRLTYTYPGEVKMIVGQQQSDIKSGTRFIGTEGEIWIDRGKLTSKPDSIVVDAQKEGGDEGLVELYRSTNHYQDFLNCMGTRQRPVCDVEIGHRTATACHLGNIALRTGKKVQWDAVAQRIVGDDQTAEMAARKSRAPWDRSFK